jgi:serine/threonine protein kinase
LDAKFNLKITDFGLSKVFQSDQQETKMKTTYVGTKGYQAPELLLNRPYDVLADVFSAGVVLFILLTGYPPFEQAHKTDKWFRPLAKGDFNKFWELHSGCQISNDPDIKDLLQKMLAYNPKNRITIADIKRHKWFNGKALEGKELVKALRGRYRQMEAKRRKDAKKLSDLQNSITRAIEGLDNHEAEVPLYPGGETEGIFDTHTTAKWKDVYNAVNTVVYEISGHTVYDFNENILLCSVKLQGPHPSGESLVRFQVQVFRSREFENGPSHEDSDREEDSTVHETIHVVRFRRLEGDVLDWKKILNQVIYKKCSAVLTGLPRWAREDLNKIDSTTVEDDNYDNFLSVEGAGF